MLAFGSDHAVRSHSDREIVRSSSLTLVSTNRKSPLTSYRPMTIVMLIGAFGYAWSYRPAGHRLRGVLSRLHPYRA